MATTPNDHPGKKKSRLWQAHLGALRKSGLSRAEYCRQHGISYHALSYQHRKNPVGKIMAPGPIIVSVPSSPENSICQELGQIRLRVGIRFVVELDSQFDQAVLHRLLAVLEAR